MSKLGYILYSLPIGEKKVDIDISKFSLDDWRDIVCEGILALHKKGKINALHYQPKQRLKKG